MFKSSIIVFISCLVGLSLASWPANIVSCPKTHDLEAYNRCINRMMKEVHPLLSNGLPEANVPRLNPFKLPALSVYRDMFILKIRANISNIHIVDATNFIVEELKGDPNKLTLNLKVKMPFVLGSCDYLTKGSLLMLPINMKGAFKGNFSNTLITAFAQGKEVTGKDGVKRIELAKMNIKIHVGNAKIKLEAPPAHKTVANAVQNLFNSSPRMVLDAFTPVFEDVSRDILSDLVKTALKTFRKDELILPS